MTIANGGRVSAGDDLGGLGIVDLGLSAGNSGTLTIGAALSDPLAAAGTLDAAQLEFGPGAASLRLQAGMAKMSAQDGNHT